MTAKAHVNRIRETAYTGETGRRRLQFCLDYTAYKKAALIEGEKLLWGGVAANGEVISCKKGCAHCCRLYVMASLQEAESIAYYLYNKEAALQHFLSAYGDWRKKLGEFERKMPRLEQLIVGNLTGSLSREQEKDFDSYVHEYAGMQAPCPFVVDNSCSIYDVRPFACAALVAVTPPETCVPDGSGRNRADYRKIEVKIDEEMPYFLKSRNPILFGCLPGLVYRLLTQGYSFLEEIPGFEGLKYKDSV